MATIKAIKEELFQLTGVDFSDPYQVLHKSRVIAKGMGIWASENYPFRLDFRRKNTWIKLYCLAMKHWVNATSIKLPSRYSFELANLYLKAVSKIIFLCAREACKASQIQHPSIQLFFDWYYDVAAFKGYFSSSLEIGFTDYCFEALNVRMREIEFSLSLYERWLSNKWGVNPSFLFTYLNLQVRVVSTALLQDAKNIQGFKPENDLHYYWKHSLHGVQFQLMAGSSCLHSKRFIKAAKDHLYDAYGWLKKIEEYSALM